jgi:hypothetical protein
VERGMNELFLYKWSTDHAIAVCFDSCRQNEISQFLERLLNVVTLLGPVS